jgi:hypothetical protein
VASSPFTLRIYAVLAVIDSVAAPLARDRGAVNSIRGLVFALAVVWFILRESRVAWTLVVVANIVGLALPAFRGRWP